MIVGREVPDILKPAYSFGGLSTSQMARDYVELWLKDKQSVSDLVDAFSTPVLKTTMLALMQGGGEDMIKRAAAFSQFRKNRDLFMVDKTEEDFDITATPLTTLDELQAQSQEHMAAIGRIPLVKLFGITPSGLNASTDGEIRVFYDSIGSQQEADFRDPLKRCIDLIQLSEFGSIDSDITFRFKPLWQLDEKAEAEVEKLEAEVDAIYLESGVLAPEEVRQTIARRKETRYLGLDLDAKAPGTPEVDGDGTPIRLPLGSSGGAGEGEGEAEAAE